MALSAAALRYRDPSNRLRLVATLSEFSLEFPQIVFYPRFFDSLDCDTVYPGCPTFAGNLCPRSP
jgi:hypothetical protein